MSSQKFLEILLIFKIKMIRIRFMFNKYQVMKILNKLILNNINNNVETKMIIIKMKKIY